MHRTKAVCEHGRPWYGECLDCEDRERFDEDTYRFYNTPYGIVMEFSNRNSFFKAHPESAAELTR